MCTLFETDCGLLSETCQLARVELLPRGWERPEARKRLTVAAIGYAEALRQGYRRDTYEPEAPQDAPVRIPLPKGLSRLFTSTEREPGETETEKWHGPGPVSTPRKSTDGRVDIGQGFDQNAAADGPVQDACVPQTIGVCVQQHDDQGPGADRYYSGQHEQTSVERDGCVATCAQPPVETCVQVAEGTGKVVSAVSHDPRDVPLRRVSVLEPEDIWEAPKLQVPFKTNANREGTVLESLITLGEAEVRSNGADERGNSWPVLPVNKQ